MAKEKREKTNALRLLDRMRIPYEALQLDRKKAASLGGEKSLELLPVKDLLAVTGYVRGGCTALGMKKQFPTVVEQSLREQPVIYVSGGRRGLQLSLSPQDLVRAAGAAWGHVVTSL